MVQVRIAVSLMLVHVFVVSVCLLAATGGSGNGIKWRSADGRFELNDANPNTCYLTRLSDKQIIQGPWDKLSREMRKDIYRFWVEEDIKQLNETRETLQLSGVSNDGIMGRLKDLHDRYQMSPYAGLLLACSMSGDKNQPDKALAVLKQVVSRIETQRVLSPQAHSNTLASAYTDSAVCLIKSKKPELAVASLLKSSSVKHLDCNVHNMSQLLKVSEQKKSFLALSDSLRKRLATALAESDARVSTSLSEGWTYTMMIDERARFDVEPNGPIAILPIPSNPTANMTRVDGWCVACEGKGFDKCSSCVKGVVMMKGQEVKMIRHDGSPLIGSVNIPTKCANCLGKGILDCGFCDDGKRKMSNR